MLGWDVSCEIVEQLSVISSRWIEYIYIWGVDIGAAKTEH